jgi:Spy/CpxP family protein refolding chaperone
MRFSVIVPIVLATVLVGQESPYTGLKDREVKALSKEDARAYREGAGMGLALAAELNRYPGPKHVLELADKLALAPEQLEGVQRSYDAMQAEAVRLGHEILDAETELDQAFATETVDPETLASLTSRIGELQGKLRFAHLRAHIDTRNILTRHQRMLYQQLRGYGSDHHRGHEH